jgi:uncharacterized protein YbgA (DUF1722 family)
MGLGQVPLALPAPLITHFISGFSKFYLQTQQHDFSATELSKILFADQAIQFP